VSYMKNHGENLAIVRAFQEMSAAQQRHKIQELERLAWEAKRAMNEYLDALNRFETERNDDAGRHADADIAAGHTPF